MSAGPNEQMARLLSALASGELHRAAQSHRSLTGMAASLGMTGGAYRGVVRRARLAGHTVPSWDELIGGGRVGADFDDEERTTPGFSQRIETPMSEPARVASKPTSLDPVVLHLTRDDVPDGSVIAVLSDIHIPHHDERALRLAVQCCEDAGATHVLLNGDIADCGPASPHEGKRRRAVLDEGSLRESVAAGLWLYEWARTKRCWLIRGNHERWVEDFIKGSAELVGTEPEALMGLPLNGEGWDVLPDLSRIRLGSRVWEHGDGFFKGGGGQNPGNRMKTLAPDQTTSVGHLHRKGQMLWSNEDEYGVSRTRAAFLNGHLSLPAAHGAYAGSYLNWQQSFEITRVWYDGDRPRFTTDQPEIFRDRFGQPIFEYGGRVYR